MEYFPPRDKNSKVDYNNKKDKQHIRPLYPFLFTLVQFLHVGIHTLQDSVVSKYYPKR